MALLKMGSLVTAISGKLGGQIASNTSKGVTLKSNSYSQQRNTPKQSAQRNKIYEVSQTWRNLTPTEQSSYNSEVVNYPYVNRVGDTVYYTGYQLYNFLNQNRLLISQPILATAPSFVAVPTISNSIYILSASQVLIDFVLSAGSMNLVYQATRSIAAGIQPRDADFLEIGTIYSVPSSATAVLTSVYISKFGAPIVGLWVWFRVKVVVPSSGNTDGFSAVFGAVVS